MKEDALTHLLLYGNNTLADVTNTFLLNSVIEYITSTKHFNDPLKSNKRLIPLGHPQILNFNSFLIYVFPLDVNFLFRYNF